MAQCEEKMLTEQLKNLCYQNGKEKSPKDSAKILHKLGILYRKKSVDRLCLLQSIALMASAIVREPDNIEEIKESLDEVCSYVLQLAGTKHSAPHVLDDIVSDLKQQIRSLRDAVEEKLNAIKKISLIAESNSIKKVAESRKIQEINDLQNFITDRYTKLMSYVCEHCVLIMGNLPCKYTLVGLGSLARKEITPYSDFESIIVLEEGVQQADDYPHVLEYFRWLATIFQMILIRLGETVLRFMAIPCLNDPLNTENNWFYDAYTPCGICPDGFAPAACKNPLGRQTPTPVKPWTTELIKPVSEMVKYLDAEEEIKNGYHLSDILTKTCFVFGSREVIQDFEQSVQDKRTLQLIKQKSKTLKRISYQLQEDFNWYNKLTLKTYKDFLDIKRILYRGSTLFVSALGSLYGLKECSCQEILDRLRILGVFSPDDYHKVKVSVAVSCEFRLRLYTLFQSQCDLVSQRYFAGRHSGALDQVPYDIGVRVLVAGVTYAIRLRKCMEMIGKDVPEQLELPLQPLWLRASVCLLLNLYEIGLRECLTINEKQDCLPCSHNDFIEMNIAFFSCLTGSGQYAEAAVRIKQFISKYWALFSLNRFYGLYFELGSSLTACHKFKSALKYFRKVNNILYFHKKYLNVCDVKNLLLSIGRCFLEMGRYSKALKYFNRGLNNEVQGQDPLRHSVTYELLYQKSHCLRGLGKETEADELNKEIIENCKMFTEEEAYDLWTNSCLYDIAQNFITTGNYQQALSTIEDAWKHGGNKNMNKVPHLRAKSLCLFKMHRFQEAYPLFQEHLQLLRHLRRSGQYYFSIDPNEAIVGSLTDLVKCASVLGLYKEVVDCCNDVFHELQHNKCKLESDTQMMQELSYILSQCTEKLAISGEWLEISCANCEETSQYKLNMDIRSLLTLGYRHWTNKNFVTAVEHFQIAFAALSSIPVTVSQRRREKIEMKILKRNSCQFVSDRYRIFMAKALHNLDRHHEAFVQVRQAWREVSILDWTALAKRRKLRTIRAFVLTPLFTERPKERFRAVGYAVTLALELGINDLTDVVDALLQEYLFCCLECLPNYDIVAYSYAPSVYYHAMKTIPDFRNLPNLYNKKWSDIHIFCHAIKNRRLLKWYYKNCLLGTRQIVFL